MKKFVPRQRKHKVRLREAAIHNLSENTNQVQLLPRNQLERDERRRKLKEELRAGQDRISGKKKKRLDKYIETKLRKDENLELLRKLSQAKFDTSRLQSSKHLGKRKFGDYVEGYSKVDRHVRQVQQDPSEGLADTDSGVESEDSVERNHRDAFTSTEDDPPAAPNGNMVTGLEIGSGLKQPLILGADGLPLLQLRKRKRGKPTVPEPIEIPWEGFDSESNQLGEVSEEVSDEDEEGEEDTDGDRTDEDSTNSRGGSEEEAEEESDASEASGGRLKPRDSAFKTWATQQINKSLDYSPQHVIDNQTTTEKAPETPSVTQRVVAVTSKLQSFADMGRTGYTVHISRPGATQEARLLLPILAEEQKIMEAIHNNPVTIVWGATGSGKTTQVPQFLFEAGYGDPVSSTPGMIGVTQPRRVAAVSMANRVIEELGSYGEKVSYQIRFDSTTSPRTVVKFMTDGILLREVSQDISLRKYSVIVIDEAHERSINTDILIGMVTRIVEQRAKPDPEDGVIRPLKLVIMSATLRVSDFLQNGRLFRSGTPPFVEAEGRQYSVAVHFSRRTHRDYVDEAFRKVTKAHRKLPHGGILVFLTGQNEIKALLVRLQNALSAGTASAAFARVQIAASEAPLETEDLELGLEQQQEDEDSDLEIVTRDSDDEHEENDFDIGEAPSSTMGVHILPLYSQLPTKEQLRVFGPPPSGSRLIILATNVAETSLTIPGIRYVFDCGRSKERLYDPTTGVQSFEVGWISKASAEQRKGRAGRTGPGHCYRLYSSAVYERDFVEHADPEILRTPMESVVLQLKSMGIDKVVHFPFPTPPDTESLLKAEKLLRNLGALSESGQVTSLGRSLSSYPLSPRFGKMVALGNQLECMPYVIALVAGMSVGDLFIPENQVDMTPVGRQEHEIYSRADHEQDIQRELQRKRYNEARAAFSKYDHTSDALKILTAVCAYAWEESDGWCEENFIRAKAMKEIMQLRKQLTNIVRANNAAASLTGYVARLKPASSKQLNALNQIVTAGFIDQVAIRADSAPNPPDVAARRPKRAIDVPYLPLFGENAVYLHPSSVLARTPPEKLPKYLVYSHLQQSAASQVGNETAKTCMFTLTATGDLQLAALARDSPLLTYGKPIGKIESLGGFPERRECVVVPALVGKLGSIGWPLTAKKVLQVKTPKLGWVIEKFLS